MVVVHFDKKYGWKLKRNFLTNYELTQEKTLFALFLQLQSHL